MKCEISEILSYSNRLWYTSIPIIIMFLPSNSLLTRGITAHQHKCPHLLMICFLNKINQYKTEVYTVSSSSKNECEFVLLLLLFTAILDTIALKLSVLRLKDKEIISHSFVFVTTQFEWWNCFCNEFNGLKWQWKNKNEKEKETYCNLIACVLIPLLVQISLICRYEAWPSGGGGIKLITNDFGFNFDKISG
jgi:hypothetical protein